MNGSAARANYQNLSKLVDIFNVLESTYFHYILAIFSIGRHLLFFKFHRHSPSIVQRGCTLALQSTFALCVTTFYMIYMSSNFSYSLSRHHNCVKSLTQNTHQYQRTRPNGTWKYIHSRATHSHIHYNVLKKFEWVAERLFIEVTCFRSLILVSVSGTKIRNSPTGRKSLASSHQRYG